MLFLFSSTEYLPSKAAGFPYGLPTFFCVNIQLAPCETFPFQSHLKDPTKNEPHVELGEGHIFGMTVRVDIYHQARRVINPTP